MSFYSSKQRWCASVLWIMLSLPLIGLRAASPSIQPSGFSGPITITQGGTYTGSWESLDPKVPAVLITTSEPVTIENATIRSKGPLIRGTDIDLTVRNTHGYGLNPNVVGISPGRFVDGGNVHNMSIEHNYLEGTSGIYFNGFKGDSSKGQTISIKYNHARNIDGRKSDGKGGFSLTEKNWAQFVQFNSIRNIQNAVIAWNEVINEPGKSYVEDNINMFKSSGTSTSPIKIQNNYIQGGYNAQPATNPGYSGGGILMGDGSDVTLETTGGFIVAEGNHIVSTSNHGIGIAGGHDILVTNNRLVSSGFLPDGSYIMAQNIGIYIWDIYGGSTSSPPTFFNNIARDNVIGWVKKNNSGKLGLSNYWFNSRTDPDTKVFSSDCALNPDRTLKCVNNTALPLPVTAQTEQAEHALWRDRVIAAKLTIGPMYEHAVLLPYISR